MRWCHEVAGDHRTAAAHRHDNSPAIVLRTEAPWAASPIPMTAITCYRPGQPLLPAAEVGRRGGMHPALVSRQTCPSAELHLLQRCVHAVVPPLRADVQV